MKNTNNIIIDGKDEKILELLKSNGDYTVRQIAKKTLMPITTVHSRINKMKKEGVIKNYTINIDHKKIGNTFTSMVLISVDYKALEGLNKDQLWLARELKKMGEVEFVNIVTGEIDMIMKVRVKDVDAFNDFLFHKMQKIKGIGKTQSMVVISE